MPCAGVAGTQSAAMLTTEMEPLVRISGSQRPGTEESVGSEAVGMPSGFRSPMTSSSMSPRILGFRSCASVSPNRKCC